MSDTATRAADLAAAARSESLFARNLWLFAGSRLSLASAAVVLAFLVMAVAAPLIAPHDPYETDLFRRLQPPAWMEGGEWSFLLGCDALGRDILPRIIDRQRVVSGKRVSVSVDIGGRRN